MAVRKTAAGLRLKRWFKEDWRTPRGKKDYKGGENTFRPTKRISKDTPSTWGELSKGEKRRAQVEKNTKGRVSKYKKNKTMQTGGMAKSEGDGNPFNTSSGRKDRFKKFTREERKKRRKRRERKNKNKNCPDFKRLGPDTKLVDGCPAPAKDTKEHLERTLPSNFRKNNKKKDNSSEYELEFNMAKGGVTTPAWTRKEGKSKSGGLNRKGIASYRKANPGSKLKMAVTTKPSKLKRGSKAAKRRGAFCARMEGMKKTRTSAKTARDPNSRINKSLRKWNCDHGCTVMVKRKSKK
tara:strand:+ start:491 stop:1372 length:882 start_codon:yes stop_codon:yes gene_type:complete